MAFSKVFGELSKGDDPARSLYDQLAMPTVAKAYYKFCGNIYIHLKLSILIYLIISLCFLYYCYACGHFTQLRTIRYFSAQK